jgi:hypothetical protein
MYHRYFLFVIVQQPILSNMNRAFGIQILTYFILFWAYFFGDMPTVLVKDFKKLL